MAEFPTIDLQSQLISRGLNPSDPAGTYTDFIEQFVRNRISQAQMEKNLAQAKETLAQSQISTRQKTAAEKAGYNPELIGTMSKEQAKEAVEVALKIKKVKVDEGVLDEWYAQLPQLVKSSDVEAFINSLTKTSGMSTWASTGTVKQETVDGVMYNIFARRDGQIAHLWDEKTGYPVYPTADANKIVYDLSDEEADAMMNRAVRQQAGNERRFGLMEETRDIKLWTDLQKAINIYNAPYARAIGQASVNNMRADRALTLLDKKGDLTKQEYDVIVSDLAAIFKGGVPDVVSLDHQRYNTIASDIASKLQYITNDAQTVHLPEIRERLRGITMDVKDVDNEVIKNYITSVVSGFEHTVKSDVPRFVRMVNAQLAGLKAPLLEDVDDLSIVEEIKSYMDGKVGKPAKAKQTKDEKSKTEAPTSTGDPLGLGPLPKGRK